MGPSVVKIQIQASKDGPESRTRIGLWYRKTVKVRSICTSIQSKSVTCAPSKFQMMRTLEITFVLIVEREIGIFKKMKFIVVHASLRKHRTKPMFPKKKKQVSERKVPAEAQAQAHQE